ncbi:hypothetical protein [Exiguobacterium undae]
MSRLIRFELYKLCTSIPAMLFIAALLLYLMSSVFSEEEANVRAKYAVWEGPATAETFKKIHDRANKINDEDHGLNRQFDSGVSFENEAFAHLFNIEEAQTFKAQGLETLTNGLAKSGFDERDRALHTSLLEQINLDTIQYHIPAEKAVTFTTQAGVAVLLFPLLLLIAFIYSKERVSGVDQYQLPAVNGRTKLLTAKLLAGSIFLTGISLVVHLGILGLVWYRFGTIDWSAPMQVMDGLTNSPYPFSIGQYWLVSFGYQTFVLIVLGIWVLAISFFAKTAIQAILWSSILMGVPLLYQFVISGTFFPETKVFEQGILFFPSRALLTGEVFKTYQTINLGIPLLLPAAILLVQVIVTLIVLKVLYQTSRKRQVV